MPSPVLSKGERLEVRRCSEAGLPDETIADQFSIPESTIRQMRFRDKRAGDPWLTPKELALRAKHEEIDRQAKSIRSHVTDETQVTALSVTAAEIARLREETPMVIAKRVSELILAGLPNIQAPKDAGELATMNNIFRKSVGLDQPQGGVNIAIGNGMSWSSGPNGLKPIVVVEPKIPEAP